MRGLSLSSVVVALAAAAVAGPGAGAAAAADGGVNFELNATSDFAVPWITESTPEEQTWMHDTYSRMRGYPPFHDQALSWGPPTDFYQDLYALYRDVPADRQLMEAHPDWVLHDGDGKELYIPYSCRDGSCPAYAADVGNPAWRSHWIATARQQLDKGYAGVFIDNVNMELMVGNGHGDRVRPIDPRTGAAMTDSDWRRYVAEFTEQIRAQLPGVTITHNAGQWWASEDDPYYQREVDAADRIELERGFSSSGLTAGNGTFSHRAYVKHIEWLHSRGAAVVLEPYLSSRRKARYEVANYLLVSEGADAISSDWHANPDNWWRGWGADLGQPVSEPYFWRKHNLWRRDYENGSAIVNPPGHGTKTFSLGSPHGKLPRAAGQHPRSRFTLRGKRGGLYLER